MTALSIQVPYQIFADSDGTPLDNGYVWIGTTNLDPRTNPINVYFDAALTQVAPNPLRTINGYVYNAGSPAQLYIDGVNFSIRVEDKKSVLVYSFPSGSGIGPDASGVVYLPAGTGAVATTVQGKLRESVSVKDFGAVGDGVTDDTAAINAFFTHIAANDVGKAECHGIFRLTGKITYSGTITSTRVVDFAAEFNSDFSAEDEILLVQGIFGLTFTGKIEITGKGSATYSSRTNGYGIVVNNCSRFSADYIAVTYTKYDAVRAVGTTSQPKFGYIRAWYCGGSGGTGSTATSVAFSGAANSGSSGSTSQRTVLTVTPGGVGSFVVNTTLLKIGSTLHLVTAFDNTAGSVTIYPWIENGVTTGTAYAYLGAGYFGVGGDNSAAYIGKLDTLVCGIGCYNRALYPVSIGSHVIQLCGAGHVIGSSISSAAVGGSAQYSYYESNDFDIVQLTTSNAGYVFGATTALTTSKAIKFSPRVTAGEFSTSFTAFDGISIGLDGLVYERRLGSLSGGSGSSISPSLKPTNTPTYSFRGNTATISLVSNSDNQRLFAMNDLLIFVRGTGTNGQPTGILTITPEAGYSINGGVAGVSVTLSGFTGPAVIHAWLNVLNWEVNVVGEQILNGSATFDPPSLTDGSGATTTLTVTGAALGDFAEATFSRDLQGITVTAWVSVADTVSVRLQNETGGTIDLASGTLRARVRKA